MFFVVLNLLIVSDFWLLLVYSSISNSALILLSVNGSYYMFVVFLYLGLVLVILYLVKVLDSYIELLLVILLFLVVPPFILFFMKFYIIYSLESVIKLFFYVSIFDVLILFYYFSLIFMKFIMIDLGVLVYVINFLIIVLIIVFRNCVAMIFFYKS